MNRYTYSFIVTIFLYFSLFIFFVFFDTNLFSSTKIVQKEDCIKISMCEPPIKQQIIKPQQKTKIQKQIYQDIPKIIEEKYTPPIITIATSKQEIQKEEQKYENVPQQVALISKPIMQPVPIIQPQVAQEQKPKITNDLAKKVFFAKLKEKINSNKFYPSNAKRRGIEGDVEIKFDILSNGILGNIEIISGNKIFYESAREAIELSLPIDIPNEIKGSTNNISLILEYKLL